MKRNGFLDKAIGYLKEAGMEVDLIEGIEPDPSVDTVMKGAAKMQEFLLYFLPCISKLVSGPDLIVMQIS